MTLDGKINYIRMMGFYSGQDILDILNEDDVYSIYERGLYKGLTLDQQFVLYLVLLTNIKIHLQEEDIVEGIKNSHNYDVYEFKVTSKVNILDFGDEKWNDFLKELVGKAVHNYKYNGLKDEIDTEVYVGGYFDRTNKIRLIQKEKQGNHEVLLIVLLTTLRAYYGFDTNLGTEELKVMVKEIVRLLDEMSEKDSSYKVINDWKINQIETFLLRGEWWRFKEMRDGKKTGTTVSFTDKDKEELKRQLKGKKGGKITMEVFRLKGESNYHITDVSGLSPSYCRIAMRFKHTILAGDMSMNMYEEVDGVDTKNYTGEEKLCRTCVVNAYQNGKITDIPIEDEEYKNNI